MESYTEEEIVEALRQEFIKLPRYSFLLSKNGSVIRRPDRSGNWVEHQAVHEILDSSVSCDWIIAKLRTARALKQATEK